MSKTEANFLADLVAFRTISAIPNTVEMKVCANYCAEFFTKQGLFAKTGEVNGFPHVIATSQKTKSPKIFLQAHLDVVPAEDKLFKMTQRDGKYLGRGVFDMKFACASYMKLAERLSANLQAYDFGIMLTFDEEIGGHHGVEALLKQGYSCEVCVLPDSGTNWQLESSGNGAWFVQIATTGKSAHGSLPAQGVNAAEKLIKVLAAIEPLKNNYSEDNLTLSVTKLESGQAINQIPAQAEATLDIRYRHKDIYSQLKTEIESICKKHDAQVETVAWGPCVSVDTEHPKVVDFIKVAEEILDKKISQSHSTGATDARYFCEYDIPCIVIQPNGGGLHADNEWVDAKGVEDLTEILFNFITKCAIKERYES